MTGRHPRHRGRAVALFFLAPLVGEYLLGNTPITDVASLLMFAPMYGGGALLIRETARRYGRGWPTMIVLAAAYALLEEGPIDMMLWNPSYGGFDIAAAYSGTYVPALGTSVQMLQDVLSMHTVWSICVPIALVEACGREATGPWLGRTGTAVTAGLFAAGSALLSAAQVAQTRFVASPAELAWCSTVIVALVGVAFALRRGPSARSGPAAPAPWRVGTAAFGVTSLYWAREFLGEGVPQWAVAGAWFGLVAASVALCARWCRRTGWGEAHRLALAGGALLTYAWVGVSHARDMDVPRGTALTGNVVFGLGAVALSAAAARSVRRREAQPSPSAASRSSASPNSSTIS
ncbi:hypothetical protein OG417_21045 [Actinoallomurus sp. NBC_01490]|uniref:hypothetical protein n=1 Tax=Actinoallomurus sp. NBC_01490 TaxID=2903557 RepID=UPI002E36E4C2|nr:hypothetical protein [Actinoallomurus sp. NBC_01490]